MVHFIIENLVQRRNAEQIVFGDLVQVIEKGGVDEAGVPGKNAVGAFSADREGRTEQVPYPFGEGGLICSVKDWQVCVDRRDADPSHHSVWSHVEYFLVGVGTGADEGLLAVRVQGVWVA